MPPYEDAAPPVPNRNAQLYEPDKRADAFRGGEIRIPREGNNSHERLMRDGYDARVHTINDHRARTFEDPRQLAYGALQTEQQFGFAFAKPKYLAAITASDRISQTNVYRDRCCVCQRMQCIDFTLARAADGCCRNSRVRRMSPCSEQNLRCQRDSAIRDEDKLWGHYLSPGSTRVQAGLRFIANGEAVEGEKLVARGLELRPEIGRDKKFQQLLAEARTQGRTVGGEVRPAPGPRPAPVVSPRDFYNYHGATDPVTRTQFQPTPPGDRSTRFPRQQPFVAPQNPLVSGPDVRTVQPPTIVRPGVLPVRPTEVQGPATQRGMVQSEAAKVFPYSRDELARREKSTMDYVAKMAPGWKFRPPDVSLRTVINNPPQRTLPTFPPIEPLRPNPPVERPPVATNPEAKPAEGFGKKDHTVGGKNFWETVKTYSKEDWVQGLAVILAAMGAVKGYQIYQNFNQDVVRQHVESEQTKVTVDSTKPPGERGVRAYDKVTGEELTRRSADGKHWEVDRGGVTEKIAVQNIDRVRYEIVAGNEREVKQFKAQLELDLKGMHDRAKWVAQLDVQHDPTMTEKQKFVFTEKGVEVGTIEAINADGTVKVKQADGSFVNKAMTADTALVMKVKDAPAQNKLNGVDIAEFMKLASPKVTLSDWTRLQGEVREQRAKEFESKLQELLDESKKAHEETKQKLEEARRQLDAQEKLNDTERKKFTGEIDKLQKELEKAAEQVTKAEERLKTEATQREAALKQYQETKTKLETAQRDLLALAETETGKRAELDKQIKQLTKDLTKNSQSLEEVNNKLTRQIEETTKARQQATELQNNLTTVQQKLEAENQRAQALEKSLGERDAEIKALAEAKTKAEEHAAEAEKQRVARETEVAQAKAELEAAKKELEGKTGTDAALKEATEKLAELQTKYDAAVKSSEAFQKQLAAETTERTKIGEELRQAQERLQKAQTDLAAIKTKTEADQKALERVEADLRNKVTELTTKLQESDKRLQTQEADQKRVSGELQQARTELQAAQAKMGGDAARIADLQKQLGERETEVKQAQEAQRVAEERAAEAEKQRTTRETELTQIRGELDAAKKEIEKKLGTDAALAEANAKMTALQEKYDAAVKARDAFEQGLKTEEAERVKQADAVRQLQEQLTKAQADLKDMTGRTVDEKAALEAAAKETATKLQAQLKEATEKLQQSEQRVTTSLQEQQRISTELQQARTALTDATTKITGDAAVIAGLQRQLDAAKEAERQANLRAQEADKQKTTRDGELATVRGELDAAKAELEKKKGTDAALAEATGKLAKLQTEYDEALKARDQFAERLKTEEAERTKQTEAVKQLQEQLTKAQAELKDMGTKTADEKAALERTTKDLETRLTEATTKLQQSEARVSEAVAEQQRVGVELQEARTALSEATARIAADGRSITELNRQLEELNKKVQATETAKKEAETKAAQEEVQRKAAEQKVTALEGVLEETRQKLQTADATKVTEVKAIQAQLDALQKQYDAAKIELAQATEKAAQETKARETATQQAAEAARTVTELQTKLAAAEKAGEADRTRLQTELAQATEQVQKAQDALRQVDERLQTQTKATEQLQTRLTQAEAALTDALGKLSGKPAPGTHPVTGKPITSGGDNYRPIAREGDTVTLLNIDRIPEGREQPRTKAEMENMFERKTLNLNGTPREFLVEKSKGDGRPQKVYQVVTEATDGAAGKVKLVGEVYVKKVSDRAGNSSQTYKEWLADYDAKKGTVEVHEKARPGITGDGGGTTGDSTSGDGPPRTPAPSGPPKGTEGAIQEAFERLSPRLQEKLPAEFNPDVKIVLEEMLEQKRNEPYADELRKLIADYAKEEPAAVKRVNELLAQGKEAKASGGTAAPTIPVERTGTESAERPSARQHTPELAETQQRVEHAIETLTTADGIKFLRSIPIAELTTAKVHEKLQSIDREIQVARESGMHDYAEELKRMKTEYDSKKTQPEKDAYAREVVTKMREAHEQASHATKPGGRGLGVAGKAGTTVAVLLVAGWLMDVTAPKAVASPSGPRVLPGKR